MQKHCCASVAPPPVDQNLNLKNDQKISLNFVRQMQIPSNRYLCSRKDNVLGLEFQRFRLIDARDGDCMMDMKMVPFLEIDDFMFEKCRAVDYHFSIGTFLLGKIKAMYVDSFALLKRF
jgi:hypothetical protein